MTEKTDKTDVAALLADTLMKIEACYLHERMWLRIPFGQPRQPEYDI